MEIRKVWAVNRNNELSFYETRDEAVREARALARPDRACLIAIYETMAGVNDEGYFEELWSDDLPEMNSSWGLDDGEEVDDDEITDIIRNGRGMD